MDSHQRKPIKWWPFGLFLLAFAAANVVLILVEAPTWARLIPVWILLAVSVTALTLFFIRRSRNDKDSGR
ncbi:hypothetical protein DFO58_1475 [Arthrobacter sp. AG1021]|nr:hypothetical protein DFO58_1475 [Arthrobacter sp. AG1021]